MWWWISAVALASWPDLSDPPRTGGGEGDTALIIGIEDYWAVPAVPGARANAQDWYRWFTEGRGTPADRVQLLLDREATAEQITDEARRLAAQAGPQGRLWVVFIGHGAPDPSGADALLLGADVQQTANSLARRGVTRGDLLTATAGAGERVLLLDSCFSGRAGDGEALAPGLQPLLPTWLADAPSVVELTAGRSDQFAGPLPGGSRPAFSYLMLGALQGWADLDGDGQVSAAEAQTWTTHTLRSTLLDRTQEPQRAGPDRVLSQAGRSDAPELTAVIAGRSRPRTVRLPDVPAAPGARPGGIGVDVKLEEQYWTAVDITENPFTSPKAVADAWCTLAAARDGEHGYAEVASASCEEWRAFAEAHQSLWDGYRKDYSEAAALLKLPRAPREQKEAALDAVLGTYGDADLWGLADVARAKERVAAGKTARLPELQELPAWMAKGKAKGGVLLGTDPLMSRHAVLPFRITGGVTTDGQLAAESQVSMAMTAGPLDFGALNLGLLGNQLNLGFYGGIAPFSIRPSKGVPGELRGSVVNPILGVGYRSGGDLRWFDLYAANHFWVTNAFGARLEYRHPLNPEVPGALTVGPVFNPGRGFWQ